MPYSSVSGIWLSFSISFIQPADVLASSKLIDACLVFPRRHLSLNGTNQLGPWLQSTQYASSSSTLFFQHVAFIQNEYITKLDLINKKINDFRVSSSRPLDYVQAAFLQRNNRSRSDSIDHGHHRIQSAKLSQIYTLLFIQVTEGLCYW